MFKTPAKAAILDFHSELFLVFLIYKLPRYFLPSFESTGLSVQKNFLIQFQDGDGNGHVGCPMGTILAIFGLQVTSIFPIKFRVN